MPRNKYNAKKVVIDGIKFDSKKEGKRYQELRILQLAGVISQLAMQPGFKFIIDGRPVKMMNGHTAKYTADFSYVENGETVYEDVKGMKTEAYRLRKAITEHIYGIKITEV